MTSQATTIGTSVDREILVIPGQYSGDMWHIAGAMLIRPSVHAVITVLGTDDVSGAKVIEDFFTSIGLGSRVTVHKGKVGREVWIGTRVYEIGDLYGKPLAWQHVASVQASAASGKNLIYPVYRSTAMIMRAIEERGKDAVRLILRAGLTSGLPRPICVRVATYVIDLLKEARGQKLLFVLGRIAGYNPQHDLNAERLQQIVRAAKSQGFSVVPIGYPKDVNNLIKQAGVKVRRCIDLRDWATLTGGSEPDERARAYFWRCLVDYAPTFKVAIKLVGGRSGSTDLPAFMGVDALCWDVCDLFNPEYLRLLMTAPEILLVTHTDTKPRKTGVVVTPVPMPQFEVDVASFLAGTFVRPKLRFQVSKSTAKKKEGAVAQEQRTILEELELVCECLFTSGTTPLAFNALNDTLRPSSGDSDLNIADLSKFITFEDGCRLLRGSGVPALATSIPPLTLLSGVTTTSSSDRSGDEDADSQESEESGSDQDDEEEPVAPFVLQTGDRVRVEYHLYYDVVGTVMQIDGVRVSVRVDHCYVPGTTTAFASDHTAIVQDRVLIWTIDQIRRKEG